MKNFLIFLAAVSCCGVTFGSFFHGLPAGTKTMNLVIFAKPKFCVVIVIANHFIELLTLIASKVCFFVSSSSWFFFRYYWSWLPCWFRCVILFMFFLFITLIFLCVVFFLFWFGLQINQSLFLYTKRNLWL